LITGHWISIIHGYVQVRDKHGFHVFDVTNVTNVVDGLPFVFFTVDYRSPSWPAFLHGYPHEGS
jgi:hypothetical protein